MDLRRWQVEAETYFLEKKIAIIQAATGSGKTRLAIDIMRKLDLPTVIITPKNVILEKTWFDNLTKVFSLHDVGLFYGDVKEPRKITVTSMQSVEKLDLSKFKFMIADEVHNLMSDRKQDILKQDFEYKLGLTATLKQKQYKHWDLLKIFDFNLFKYDIDMAIGEEVLSQFTFTNVGLDLLSEEVSEYEELQHRIDAVSQMMKNKIDVDKSMQYALIDKRKKLLANSPQKRNVLYKLAPSLRGKKIIIFNEYNAIATPIYWTLTDLGFNPCIFNTDIGKTRRMENLHNYSKDKHDVIITTRALDEGYDLPHIDVAIILSGGSTSRQMIQRVGRVLRKTENDKEIYQVYFRNTIEHEAAMERYDLMRDSCKEYKEMSL